MAEYADRVVTELIADTTGHDPKILTSARVTEQAMTQIERSATQAETRVRASSQGIVRSVDQISMRSRLLGYQISDIGVQLAGGQSPFIILAQQAPQVANALEGTTGVAGRMATFFSGAWGAGLLAGASVLAIIISKLVDFKSELQEAIDKLEENAHKTEINRQAQAAFALTLNGITEAIRTTQEALDQLAHSHDSAAQRALVSAFTNQNILRTYLATTEAIIEQTRAQIELNRSRNQVAGNDPRITAPLNAENDASVARLQDLELQHRYARDRILQTAGQVRDAISQVSVEEGGRSPEDRIHQRYDRLVEAARLRAKAERAVGDQLARQVATLREQERQEVAAQQRSERESRRRPRDPTASFNREATDNNGEALIATARNYSGFSENNGNQRAALESFFHQAGINIDPRVTAWCAAFVNAVLHANGLPVQRGPDGNPALGARQFLNYGTATRNPQQGDIVVLSRAGGNSSQGHVGFFNGYDANGNVRVVSGNSGRGSQSVTSGSYSPNRVLGFRRAPDAADMARSGQQAERQAAQLAERRQRDEEQFQQQMAGLGADILNARRRQVQTEEEAADADVAAIRAEQAERDTRIRNDTAARIRRDATQATSASVEEGILLALSQELADTKERQRRNVEQQRLEEQRIDIATRDLNDQESVLRARGQLARTAVERRDIELRLLDLAHQEELLAIQKQRAQQGLSPAQLAQLDRQEAAINTRYGLDQQNVLRQTAGPLESFLNAIPSGAQAANEAMQTVAVEGIQAVNDGLAQAAVNFFHLGGTAGRVLDTILSDLIRVGLQMAEMAVFGGGKGGGILSFLGIGSSTASAGGFDASSFIKDAFTLFGHADGYVGPIGGVGGRDRNVLSINGQPRARVSGSETLAIIPQGKALGYSGGAAMMGGQQAAAVARVEVELHGDIDGRIASVSGPISVEVVRRAAPQLIEGAKSATIRSLTRPRLNR